MASVVQCEAKDLVLFFFILAKMNLLRKTGCSADLRISAFEKQGGQVRFPDNPFYKIKVNGNMMREFVI